MDPGPAAGEHPAQRWINATFGAVDPFSTIDQTGAGWGRPPAAGRHGRSTTEGQVRGIERMVDDRYCIDILTRDGRRVVSGGPLIRPNPSRAASRPGMLPRVDSPSMSS